MFTLTIVLAVGADASLVGWAWPTIQTEAHGKRWAMSHTTRLRPWHAGTAASENSGRPNSSNRNPFLMLLTLNKPKLDNLAGDI
jgi:hypothetical protein